MIMLKAVSVITNSKLSKALTKAAIRKLIIIYTAQIQ
jgi:hypothetical protein